VQRNKSTLEKGVIMLNFGKLYDIISDEEKTLH
jgi:hypothetical protein